MCGILGSIPSIDENVFQESLDTIAHRGPDGMGIWKDDSNVQLGHRRLSILDLSDAASQPMHFLELALIFNGEIYNYLEIRDELQKRGYDFKTQSDSEVLVKAFHCWGEACLHKLNGMWAFAIYNKSTKEIFIARDRYGVKPLYYYKKGQQFFFASELRAVHHILGASHPLDSNVLANLVRGGFDWHGGRATWLKDVYVLQAGTFLTVREGSLHESRWYQLKEKEVPKRFEDQAVMLKELLTDACNLRLRSDVPIGTCLSGGLDSSSITSLIKSQQGNYTHRSFCASFPDTPIDESGKALKLASKLNSTLDIIAVTPPGISDLEVAMNQCDGPMHALAFFPIWKLYQHIRNAGIKVTLDGQGPDEMLGGYRPVASAVQYGIRRIDPFYVWDAYATYREQGETDQVSSKRIARNALVETLKSELKRPISLRLGKQTKQKHQHPFRTNAFDEELYNEFFVSPLPGILQQYDRCSMAHGVECRMPFMDYRVVEYIFSLPIKSKVGKGYTKRVLREAMKDIVPDEIRLDKKKIGFNAPIVDWYIGPLKDWMLDIMGSKEYQMADFFDGRKLKNEFENFVTTAKPQWNDAWKFWGSVHFAWWKKNLKTQWNSPQ
ncbi:MAG: asparagine synthase (glutamine-hydrolyzing) [Bacteroidetes bacterium]|nr:asparagine synthase (glutamine-hydrolyzing) [Bacteroidota bacterium]